MKLGIRSFHEIYNNDIDIFRDKEHQKEKYMALKSSNLEVVRSHFLKMEMIIKNYLSSLGGDVSIGVIISADDFKNHFYGGGSKEEINNITNENNYITNNDNNDDILNETIKENQPKDDKDDFRKDNLGKGRKDDINKETPRRRLENEKIEGNTHFSNDVRFKKNEMNHITSLKGHSPFNNPTSTSILVRQGGIRHRFSKGISGKNINSFDFTQGIGNIENPSLRQDNKNANYVRSNIIRRNPPNFIINS